MRVRAANEDDEGFIVEMARHACTLEDRPLPQADDRAVVELVPHPDDVVVVAVDESERRLGAAWCHFHEPPLVRGARGEPLPEAAMGFIVVGAGGGRYGVALRRPLRAHG